METPKQYLTDQFFDKLLTTIETQALDALRRVDKLIEEREQFLKNLEEDKKRLEWLVWKENLN